jgi:hypothetical protein
MPITGTSWRWFHAWGNGYHTVDVNIAPDWVGAQVNLHGHTGGGTSYTGIQSYRRRLSSGQDETVAFGEWPSWPPAIFDFISSITFAIATGSGQTGWLVARMDFWD